MEKHSMIMLREFLGINESSTQLKDPHFFEKAQDVLFPVTGGIKSLLNRAAVNAAQYTGIWTSRNAAAENSWMDICWSPALNLFCAVSVSGTNDRVMTSPDGITWTSRNAAAENQWCSVCWSPALNLFCAVSVTGTNDRVMTSPDGITWTSRNASSESSWYNICWSPELNLFCAVSISATSTTSIMTSPDGITWIGRISVANTNNWLGICWSPALNLFCVVAYSGTNDRVMTSPDGITWTGRISAADNQWRSVCWSPELSLFCAVAYTGTNDRVMTSPDGITWMSRDAAAENDWTDICWSPELSLFYAVSVTGTNDRVMTSPDGITWTSRDAAAENEWSSICLSSELSLFCAVAYTGTNDRVMTSPEVSKVRGLGQVVDGGKTIVFLSSGAIIKYDDQDTPIGTYVNTNDYRWNVIRWNKAGTDYLYCANGDTNIQRISEAYAVSNLIFGDAAVKPSCITSLWESLIFAAADVVYISDSFSDTAVYQNFSMGQTVTALARLNGSLLVFTETNIFQISLVGLNSAGDYVLRKKEYDSSVGTIGQGTVQEIPGAVIFLSNRGFYLVDSTMPRPISLARLDSSLIDINLSKVGLTSHSARDDNNYTYLCALPVCAGVTNSRVYVYNYVTKTWALWNRAYSVLHVNDIGSTSEIYGGTEDGWIYDENNSGVLDTAAEIRTSFMTRSKSTTSLFKFHHLYLNIFDISEDVTMSVRFYIDWSTGAKKVVTIEITSSGVKWGTENWGTFTWGGGNFGTLKIPVFLTGRVLQIEIIAKKFNIGSIEISTSYLEGGI